jgi:ribosomal protein S25
VSRAHYRDGEDRPDPMGAGKDSGDIEFAAGLLFVMTSVKNGDGLVRVEVPKIKRGLVASITFSLAPSRPGRPEFKEVETETENEHQPQGNSLQEKAAEICQRVLETIVRKPGISPSKLEEELKVRYKVVNTAVSQLTESGQVREEKNRNVRHLFYVGSADRVTVEEVSS